VEAIMFTHGSTTSERDVRDNDYAGVANVLKTLDGSPVRMALMTPSAPPDPASLTPSGSCGQPQTLELIADHGPEQDDLTTITAARP
jgi:hypothetical protein